MFSPKLIVFIAFVAVAATYPANDDIPRPITTIMETDIEEPSLWFNFPSLHHIFGQISNMFTSFTNIGPTIDVDDDKFRIIVNVKDYKKENLKVKVKNDFILIQGSQEAKQDDHDLFASNFFHTYNLPVNASASEVTATLTSDGFLVVDAPLNGNGEKTNESVDRVVPIVESGEPLKKKNKGDKADKTAKNLPSRTMSMTIPNNEVNEVSAANEVKP
ncbi:unnamed protein product [Euphydryas editha]|uniref:SHSP domain-containing protein n=1 Tax=Euphydryas editha TaxID=104508 RepID=A0AAU9UQS7_EUPED|nr:unnamed protein product [Euphydryas editha]